MQLLVVHGPWLWRLWCSSRCNLEDAKETQLPKYISSSFSSFLELYYFILGSFIFSFFVVVRKVFTLFKPRILPKLKRALASAFFSWWLLPIVKLHWFDSGQFEFNENRREARLVKRTWPSGCLGHFGGEISTIMYQYLRWNRNSGSPWQTYPFLK